VRPALVRLALAVSVAVPAGCGVPSESEPRPIAAVPYGLLSPGETATSRPSAAAGPGPSVYLLQDDDRLEPVEVSTTGPGAQEAVRAVLAQLSAGPSEQERAAGLATALGPEVTVSLRRLVGDTAEVDVGASASVASAGRLPLAVGQVVLSVTSVGGVSRVVLTEAGRPLEAPLPGGALTSNPLTAADYRSLVGSRPEGTQPTTG
jgi:hypothetical protein